MSNFKKLSHKYKCNINYYYYVHKDYYDKKSKEYIKIDILFIDELEPIKDNYNKLFYNSDSHKYYYNKNLKNWRCKYVLGSEEQYNIVIDNLKRNVIKLKELSDKEYQDFCNDIKKYVLFIKEEVSASIIRKIYDRVNSTEKLIKMSPFLAYQIGRNSNKDFYIQFIEMIEELIKKTVNDESNQLKENIIDFIEMLIAYYKYYVPKENQ
ncbi:MAG: type III-A CRISPR-associated protein Csm2 [Vallitalea sp.]|jgi:CRISPR type III-A-associated protein Csm2|nr:type III-A CRISPR-associated protein Csm2 [Vallitalea sp.]